MPETDNLKEREDNEVSVSLGWTAHITLMISSLLTVPTRYQINHLGSRYSPVLEICIIFDPHRKEKRIRIPKIVLFLDY